jgi:hypothetical protein
MGYSGREELCLCSSVVMGKMGSHITGYLYGAVPRGWRRRGRKCDEDPLKFKVCWPVVALVWGTSICGCCCGRGEVDAQFSQLAYMTYLVATLPTTIFDLPLEAAKTFLNCAQQILKQTVSYSFSWKRWWTGCLRWVADDAHLLAISPPPPPAPES